MKLTFEEKEHKYFVDGKEVPSVSKIMESVSMPYYDGIDPHVLEKAAYRGTQVHKAIEDFERWGDYELEKEYQPYMLQYKCAKKIEGFIPIELEQKLTNGEFAGTYDILAEWKNKRIFIDIKTSSILNKVLVAVQFAGYKILSIFNKKNVDEYYALHLTKTNYHFVKIKPADSIFKACFKIWKYMKGENK